ncbi:hypothetical protein B0T19DRAFT_414710 [Cercophora scortea]|uniref:DUF676 domain-containing protein n=1 Tax=Cercophora scortea TaxID=314031 RepID=A0AAE0MHP2_9PEZI|nr:hypothetical protein B0T19DRAFT_414710 [Cercophora scortea]
MENDNRGRDGSASKAEAEPGPEVVADNAWPERHPRDSSPSQGSQATAVGRGGSKQPRSKSIEFEMDVLRPDRVSNPCHANSEPGFAHVDGDVDGPGYNDTKVDIIAVPCPGADPVQTWIRDPLPDHSFDFPTPDNAGLPTVAKLAGKAILSPAVSGHFARAPHMWARQGIRGFVSTARVMLYRHRALADGMDLEGLAMDLLDQIQQLRQGTGRSRPLFFIAHSIGGLAVKLALVRATQLAEYREIMYNCHGVSFFATPHRGSSYMSMKNLRESIRQLLHLQRPIPESLARELRVNNSTLATIHEDFVDIMSELRVWTFYETLDSQLSGYGAGGSTGMRGDSEVRFGAPLVSIKSALLDVWEEDVFSVESDHANIASFGPRNLKTMTTYLKDLTAAIIKARDLSDRYTHTPLKLKDHVKVELVSFYEDPDAEMEESTIRLYSTKTHLGDFLIKGPERCLEERLGRAPSRKGSLLIDRPSILPHSPDIVVTSSSARPSLELQGGLNLTRAVGSSGPALSVRSNHPSSSGSTHTPSEPSLQLSGTDVMNSSGTESKDFQPASHNQPAEHLSRAYALQYLTAGFSRPNPSLKRFMWIHLPFNNPLWVKEIFGKLAETQGQNFEKVFSKENWVSKHVQSRDSKSQPSYVKPSCSYIPAEITPSPRISLANLGRTNAGNSPNCLYLFLPYLHFDTYCNIIRRRDFIHRRLKHGRASPVPEDVASLESLEMRVIWQHLGFDPPLNCRRTLDQFGYPSLHDTNARDDDQMLYKLTKEDARPQLKTRDWRPNRHSFSSIRASIKGAYSESSSDEDSELEAESHLRDGKLLMVDQLWLWALDTTTLTTFFPKRESSLKEGTLFQQADLRNSVYNELNGDLTGRTQNALDLAAFIALHAVTVFLDKSSHPDLEIFRIFDEAIGILAERMTSNMKKFRSQTFTTKADDTVFDEHDPEGSNIKSIKKRHKRELERAERENRENTSALLELRDMEDELTTLQKLFDTQDTTIRVMHGIYLRPDLHDITTDGRRYLDEALEHLSEYKQTTADMIKRVDTTRKDYEKMLEMAQRQAQVDEVRWSRLQTELASSQNLSVMIFTTFTVVFLPLGFFTSLFGMNTAEWDGEGNVPSLGTIGAISLPCSIFLIFASLVAAYSSRIQGIFKATYENTRKMWKAGRSFMGKFEPKKAKFAKQMRKEEQRRERRERIARRQKERTYDLWATVKEQRSLQYEIPVLNRRRSKSGGQAVVGRKSWMAM